MNEICKKHGIKSTPAHQRSCDKIPPIDDIISMLRETPLHLVAASIGISPQSTALMAKARIGKEEYTEIVNSHKGKRKPYTKPTTAPKCINCKILLTADDTGMTCNMCLSG
jgi:hypothetical protein